MGMTWRWYRRERTPDDPDYDEYMQHERQAEQNCRRVYEAKDARLARDLDAVASERETAPDPFSREGLSPRQRMARREGATYVPSLDEDPS